MKRVVLLLALLPTAAVLGACGAGEVTVQAQLEGDGETAEALALEDLEVWLLPYDRDALFDSLEAAYPEPQPEIPDSVLALQDRMTAAQDEWQAAEREWNVLRDSLKTISDRLEGLDRGDAEYMVLYRDFNRMEPRTNALGSRSESAFNEFTELQNRFVSQAESLRALRSSWANQAFQPVDSIIAARLDELEREEYADTTSAAGVGRFTGLKEGQWWVHARYELPHSELYWNVPVTVAKGEPLTVTLSRANAEERPSL